MTGNIEYIVAGGPLHGRTYPSLPSDDGIEGSSPAIVAVCSSAVPIDAARQSAGGHGLRIAAKRRLGGGDTVRYIVLHPQATGEQFLTILAA
jgi:hypothetical protein